MRYAAFTEKNKYSVCILVPDIRKDDIQKAYLTPFNINTDDVVIIDLAQEAGKKKSSVGYMKEYVTSELVPVFDDIEPDYVIVSDSEYFKVLTKTAKAEAHLGYVMDSPYGKFKVVYVPNYKAIFYDPEKIKHKIAQGINALNDHRMGVYRPPGDDIVKFEEYPTTEYAIKKWLDKLLEMNVPLSIDIEAFDLKHHKAGIGTITFCWNQHEGIAFPVDYQPIKGATEAPYGKNVRNEPVRKLLKEFFIKYKKKAIYHHIAFDVYVLIYQLFMKHILDTEGLLEGIEVMLGDWDDTKLISYLATNSCAGNKLGLKDQSQEYSGNYAVEEIKDITRIPMEVLLRYNLVDGISTWYVHNKRMPQLVADQQDDIYQNIFKPATVDIIQMQLTGLPVCMPRVKEVRDLLQADFDKAVDRMRSTQCVKDFTYRLNENWVIKRNQKLKTKVEVLANAKEVFNPNSGPQLQELLFEHLGLPVLKLTDSNQPSTDGDTIKALVHHTKDPDVLEFLTALADYAAVNIILTSFIPAMEQAALGPDGWHYLFGNFNLGGTVSGRLSSSGPNLQNLPATGSKYAKLIKSCFQAPPGWLFVGLDFNSLEDRISALTTKDPNKLKVYTDGYDGHSLRAYAYFGDQMPDIENTVDSINSIQDKYKPLRQESKVPTFLLTYGGTWKGMTEQCGFTKEKAMLIEKRYHELYVESDAWVAKKLDQAMVDGYVTVAFGLRVRTPLLKQVIRGNSKTPYEAEKEGRTAGNALGQSWCLLNTRAGSEFMGGVRVSEFRTDIRPCAQIHDAGYFLVRDDIRAVNYTNKNLVKAVEWQQHPDIAHDEVKLGGKLSIFYPDWSGDIEIPNGIFGEDIINVVSSTLEERSKKSSK